MSIVLTLLLSFSISAFEDSFTRGEIKNLEKYFPDESKVYVEISVPFNVYGFLSKSQILALFKNIFYQFETKKFKIKEKIEGGNSIVLRIEWVIFDKIMEETKNINIFIRLSLEKNQWYISEIKGD